MQLSSVRTLEPIAALPKKAASADRRHNRSARSGEISTMPGVAQRAAAGFDRRRREELVARLQADPAIVSAFARWPRLSPIERLATLRAVTEHMGLTYRFTPAPMRVVRLPADESGSYDDATRRIEISQRELAATNPRAILDTVVHEQLHAYQHQKIMQRRAGQLPVGSALRRQALVWGHNDDRYIPAERDEARYMRQPVEKHAYANAEALVRAFLGNR